MIKEQKNILITGVSKGLGLIISEILLDNDYNIYGISRTETKELKNLLNKNKDKFKWLCYDLKNVDNIKNCIFKNWIGFETPIHVFINNAAIAYDDIVTNLDTKKLFEMYAINVFSPMNITKYVIRHMLLHKIEGSIIHISSICAHTGYNGLSMYASTKGSLEAFSKSISREWGKKGIRSNCLVAGFMETDMSSNLTSEQRKKVFDRTSLKKPICKYSVAETINFLISEKSSSITGQNIYVDNGTI
jgi:3-oxoacyl-[acyl-carrier protein] reductase